MNRRIRLNYRRFYNQADLVRFSEVLAVQGITAPVTLRKMETGRWISGLLVYFISGLLLLAKGVFF